MTNKSKPNVVQRIWVSVFVLLLWTPFSLMAADSDDEASGKEAKEYSSRGADTCLKCHDEDWEYPLLPIFKSKHGEINDPRTPMAKLQCETCHGPVGDHDRRVRRGQTRPPMIMFGREKATDIQTQNKMCLQCHDDHRRMNWTASAHERKLSCADCHQVHVAKDPVLLQDQREICFECHIKQRAEFHRTSSHPVRYGKIRCSQCHNPHGSVTGNLLKAGTKNQLCYSCHAEKRGPYLWSHAPVSEDCGNCHESHGSMHPTLLKRRPPLLCQQCHAPSGHPSLAQDGGGLPGGSPSVFLLGNSCLNCHSQVHGSNHPSGVKLMR